MSSHLAQSGRNTTRFWMGRCQKKPEGWWVVTLFEIYETEDGLHHHWIESKDIHLLAEDWLKEVGGEITVHTHQTIMQSLWD